MQEKQWARWVSTVFALALVLLVAGATRQQEVVQSQGPDRPKETVGQNLVAMADVDAGAWALPQASQDDWVLGYSSLRGETELEGGELALSLFPQGQVGVAAMCGDSVSVGGHALDQCQGTTFTLGGDTWTLSAYYTLDTAAADHWIMTDTQAVDVIVRMQESYEAYYEQTGRTYGASVCGRHIRAKIQKGSGWAGIAWWPNSCYIGLDAPMIRGGGGRHTTYHEMRHKVFQFAYNDCVDDWKSGYAGNADIVEGDADYGPSTVGNYGYFNNALDPHKSMYAHGYGNRFIPYYSEHTDLYIGPMGSPGDFDYLAGGMVRHMQLCETYDDLYVERELVESETPYTYEEFFTNYFAANWAFSWADSTTQPELYYFEADAPSVSVSSVSLDQDINMSSGTQSFNGESTPAHWAGRYYQVRPQAGCDYLMVEVDHQSGGQIGISVMGADTSAPSVVRSAWVGKDFERTVAAHGVHDRIVAVVNAFSSDATYDVRFTCVTPVLDILEPRVVNFALVGDPASPIAFLARFTVKSGSTPVRGLPESSFTFDAEGDAITVVAGTLQEIGGGEYWATLLPPSKAAGTTFVDLRVCLDGTICDREDASPGDANGALLYVAPGNSDIMILHDASGSMATEDVIGEGTRLENAQKAAIVIANLVRSGDRISVMDFSAFNSPAGCDPNCPLDIQTHLPRTDITNPSTQIPAIESAINATSAREWTPVGEGAVAAKNALQAAPYSLNPKHVVLLGDGEENINRMYSAVQAEIIASGVVFDTVNTGDSAGAALMSQIAADTGGIYRYVPSSTGTTSLDLASVQSISQELAAALPEELASQLTSAFYPGQLSLADTYDYYETKAQGAARLLNTFHTTVPDNAWRTQSIYVDESVNVLRLVVPGKQADASGCSGYHRDAEVLSPGDGQRDWAPFSPPSPTRPLPAGSDVRNSKYVDVLIVPNPQPGIWQVRAKYYYAICDQGIELPVGPQAITSDFLLNGSVQSTFRLEGRFREPYEDGLGYVGEPVPIVAALMQKTGTKSGAVVWALIERPGGSWDLRWLFDDGEHGDGSAGDGIYANTYYKTTLPGSYNVGIGALFPDPNDASNNIWRGWLGGFWVKGLPEEPGDDDNIPGWWERLYPCMDPQKYDDPQGDYDKDGLSNWDEWQWNLNPCDPDTDGGGETDGSEVTGGRNPHWPGDDRVKPIPHWTLQALNGGIVIRWSRPFSYTRMYLRGYGQTDIRIGTSGVYTVPASNGDIYTLQIYGETDDGVGAPTDPMDVTPKADPDPPSGFVLIEGDAPATTEKSVQLYINASDELLDGMPSPGGALSLANQWTGLNEVSGNVEMRFQNPGATWTAWEPLASSKPWTLDCNVVELCTVYAQFRDGAGNESAIVFDTIFYEGLRMYLPLVVRQYP